ncbi:MAG TPA: sugar phosphate isomerase/epimerase family protein [Anaerolineae bacterium]|nr:sugar phosphate isomerase/epimerase family protein [Anaerolineae bacterium]
MSKTKRTPIGIISMSYWSKKLEDAIPLAADTGYDSMEIWTEHLWKFQERPSHVGSIIASNKMRATVHCPVMDTNITSPNLGIREESVRQFLQAVEMSHDMGAELLVIHPGHLYSLNETLDDFWGLLLQSLERIVKHAQKYGVALAIENMDVQKEFEVVKRSEHIRRITKHFEAEKLGVVLDTTHLSSVPQIIEYIQNTDCIVHTHLSDARITPRGSVDTHLPLGEGELDFQQVFDVLLPNYHGIVSFETFVPPAKAQTLITQREWLDSLLNSR